MELPKDSNPQFPTCHVVAMPYPGRGHINPMMNLCKLIAMKRPNFLITFIVTEEWHGLLNSQSTRTPANIHYGKIPNVIPSEKDRGKDLMGFAEAVFTKMEAPVELLLSQLDQPTPRVIISDAFLPWVVGLAGRRNIPVAALWTQSATMFSILHHFDLILQNHHVPSYQLDEEQGEQLVDYIPGVSSIRVRDLPKAALDGKTRELFQGIMNLISKSSEVQYFLFSSIDELEYQVINSLKAKLTMPIYVIGPAIPYLNIKGHGSRSISQSDIDCIAWLDAQPQESVLYISQGSFLSVSSDQLCEIVAGVVDSAVRFLWVTRKGIDAFLRGNSHKGLVVGWCEQLKVLCHSSVGGFWSHCGWNSAKEGAYAGVPMLTFPIIWDQITNSKQIVDDWRIGWRVKKDYEQLVMREDISEVLKRFMDLESDERKEMKRRAREVSQICHRATAEGGSAHLQIDSFLGAIS